MGDKIKKIYQALVDGAVEGKSGKELFAAVLEKCPKATSKKIVKASLLALSDPDIKDANVLHVIYALAIKHRLDPASKEDLEQDADSETVDDDVPVVETPVKRKARKAKSEAGAGA